MTSGRVVNASIKCLAILCTAVSAYAATPACVPQAISPGGDPVVTRFIAAPLSRTGEVIADAMQATGVLLFKNTEQSVEGERALERVNVLRLPKGDEAIHAKLTPIVQDGKAGAQVRVETLRRGNKKGTPKHAWSTTVLDQAACLVSLLSLDDPLQRPRISPAEGAEIPVADSIAVPVRSRHFFFNTDLKTNQIVPFETAEDVAINESIVIPAGSLVTASMEEVSDIGEFGRGAKGQIRFKYLVLPDGARLALRGIVDLRGKGADLNKLEKTLLVVGSVATRTDLASGTGSGFAVPAGTLFQAEVDGEQKFRVSRATLPMKDQN